MNLFDLTGKTALITGAAGGLGIQFAHTLSAAGARILLTDICIDLLKDVGSTLSNAVSLEMFFLVSLKKPLKLSLTDRSRGIPNPLSGWLELLPNL